MDYFSNLRKKTKHPNYLSLIKIGRQAITAVTTTNFFLSSHQ